MVGIVRDRDKENRKELGKNSNMEKRKRAIRCTETMSKAGRRIFSGRQWAKVAAMQLINRQKISNRFFQLELTATVSYFFNRRSVRRQNAQ